MRRILPQRRAERNLRPAVLESEIHRNRRLLPRRHARRSLHRRRQDRAGHPEYSPRRRRGDLSLALQHGVPIGAIRHAVTRNNNGEAASILGAIVDRLTARGTA